ncbi:uncharacterized protein [Antedon mediterranea]|uniref:uncharacterized protein n=1 Tax=Antedon mediterranea TaxID=105859 RepID=UPI003AF84C54
MPKVLHHEYCSIINLSAGDESSLVKPATSMTQDIQEKVQEEVLEIVKNMFEKKKLQVEKDLLEKSEELQETIDDLTLSIWDFAGQDLYYITHQMFLVSRAIYIICFNLCHDLNAPSRVEVVHRDNGKVGTDISNNNLKK